MRIRMDLRCLFLAAVLALGWPYSPLSQMSAEEMPHGVLKVVSVNETWRPVSTLTACPTII